MCVSNTMQYLCYKIIFHLKKCSVTIEAMVAANFSRDVLEMFYGDNFPQERLPEPIRPNIRLGFEIARRRYNRCPWLMTGRNEICGKSCRGEYCNVHSFLIRRGSIPPLPCLGCGVGVRSFIQLCIGCGREKERRRIIKVLYAVLNKHQA